MPGHGVDDVLHRQVDVFSSGRSPKGAAHLVGVVQQHAEDSLVARLQRTTCSGKLAKCAEASLKGETGLARIMHHLPRFCMPGPHAYCTRTTSVRPVWIGVRQLAVQLVWV
jgi:hypothetical protein